MNVCGKHLDDAVRHELTMSDVLQAKVRILHPSSTDVSHCEKCDTVATYQVVAIMFSMEVT